MMGKAFKKLVISCTNDFPGNRNDDIRRWVTNNGGIYTKEITNDVTHLIASTKAWKQYHPTIQKARRMRTVQIVRYEWLEDSLQHGVMRALPTKQYTYEQSKFKAMKKPKRKALSDTIDTSLSTGTTVVKVARDKRIEATGIEFDRACEEFKTDMGVAGFHPYFDDTGFAYVIMLVRRDILKKHLERHRLKVGEALFSISSTLVPQLAVPLHHNFLRPGFGFCPLVPYHIKASSQNRSNVRLTESWAQCIQLYESDTPPHTYACYTQFTRPGAKKQVHTLAPPGSTWDFAWTMFQKFFANKVKVSWSNRAGAGPDIGLNADMIGQGRTLNEQQANGSFWYLPPKKGEPEGVRQPDTRTESVSTQHVLQEVSSRDISIIRQEEPNNHSDDPNRKTSLENYELAQAAEPS